MVVSIPAIAKIVVAASPAAFFVIDKLCDTLVEAEPDSRAIVALQVACEVRKASKRRRRK